MALFILLVNFMENYLKRNHWGGRGREMR